MLCMPFPLLQTSSVALKEEADSMNAELDHARAALDEMGSKIDYIVKYHLHQQNQ